MENMLKQTDILNKAEFWNQSHLIRKSIKKGIIKTFTSAECRLKLALFIWNFKLNQSCDVQNIARNLQGKYYE